MEFQKVTCKHCGETKSRVHLGFYPNSQKRFVDEQGNLWVGRKCPACVVLHSKLRMRSLREQRKLNEPS